MNRSIERTPLSLRIMNEYRRSAMIRMTGVVYGLTLISFTIVFAVSSALQTVQNRYDDNVNNNNNDVIKPMYLEVFQIYIYAVSLILLIYLKSFILCHRQRIDIVEEVNGADEQTDILHENEREGEEVVIGPKTTIDNKNSSPQPESTPKNSQLLCHHDEVIPYGVTFDGDGVNLYLRIGALVFGAGSMIQNGFQLAQLYQDGRLTFACFSLTDVVVTCLQMSFTFFQAFCVFKSHKIVIRSQRGFFRVVFMHLIMTNLSMWMLSTVHHIVKLFLSLQDVTIHNNNNNNNNNETTTNGTSMECSFMKHLSSKASPFLHPCSVQYALISAMLTYQIYRQMNVLWRVDKCFAHADGDECSDGTEEATSIETQRSKVAPAVGCDKTHKGLFLGLLVVVLTVVSISCFFVFVNSENSNSKLYATLIYFLHEYTLLFLACITTLAAMLRIKKLSFVSASSGRIFKAEKILLVISYPGLVLIKGFYLVALANKLSQYFKNNFKLQDDTELAGFSNDWGNVFNNPRLLLTILASCSSGAVLLHGILQTRFIIDALNREVSTSRQRVSKPGRSLVAFLLLCNLSLFFTAIFEEERIEASPLYVAFYQNTAWYIISSIAVPLLIFFRFLSVVCLLTVWRSTYFPKE